jgi:hypothetical protein
MRDADDPRPGVGSRRRGDEGPSSYGMGGGRDRGVSYVSLADILVPERPSPLPYSGLRQNSWVGKTAWKGEKQCIV